MRSNLRLEPLESRQVLAGDLVISEIMASNDNGIRDEDHNRPDWIEILNTSGAEIDLNGWFLTDDAADLDKWQLPQTSLAANARLVVFASGKHRQQAGRELHTNFRLDVEGEYLALVRPDGKTVEFDLAPTYPTQVPDVSYGIPQEVHTVSLLEPNQPSRLLVPSADDGPTLGREWTSLDFNDAQWNNATSSIGYEQRSNYETIYTTDVGPSMLEVNASIYMRVPFELVDATAVYQLTLGMQYDDGFVAYINGQEIARRNAPDDVNWSSTATDAHPDREAVNFEDIAIDPLAFDSLLKDGTNVLAIHALNDEIASSDFLMVPRLNAQRFEALRLQERHFFAFPTPGEPNAIGSSTLVSSATHQPLVPTVEDALHVSATVYSTADTPSDVTLHYRVMFDDERSAPMYDDGLHNDGAAGDGIYGTTLPPGLAPAGQMIRYYVTAGNGSENVARLPVFSDPLNTEQYFGTIIDDPAIQSHLKVIHWFLEDPEGKNTDAGTRGSLYHDGKFYDNIHIDTTGRTVGLAGPKKSHDVFFPSDHWFELEMDGHILRMNDFDLISDFWNRAKVRVPLGYQTLNEVGTPAHLSMPVRVQENGEFYATYSFVDGGNERFLQRAGLDPGGALYKMNLGFSPARGVYKKQTRTHEDSSDLVAFFDGLALTGEQRRRFLLDHVNIPATVNYLAGLVIMGHGDCCNKNLYIYRDTEGSAEWEPLPWDVDSAFGRGGVALAQFIFPTAAPLFTGLDNPLFKALFDDVPEFRAMYLRRLRTLMDEFIQPPGTPPDQLHLERRIDAMVAEIGADAALDFGKWGTWIADPETNKVIYGDEGLPTWEDHVRMLKTEYLPARRTFLYNSLRSANRGVEIPGQIDTPVIEFGEIESSPASDNQDEEYITLSNPNDVAVDLSGWRITGDVQFTFAPGTVITAGGTLYVSPQINTFRTRSTGPSGSQNLFVVGNYAGHLSNHGASLHLLAPNGTEVDQAQTEARLSPAQKYLRISEIMYHPRDPADESRFREDDYEYIELINISDTEPVSLEHVALAGGITYTVPDYTLAPQARAVIVRDQAAFLDRYGDQVPIIPGEYGRTEETFRLSDSGELLRLEIATGDLIQEFTYSDQWWPTTDGDGASLVIRNPLAELDQWNLPTGWQASRYSDGSPGTDEADGGDVDGDGAITAADIDLFCSGLRAQDPRFDFVEDAAFNDDDVLFFIQRLARVSLGDTNLDGIFDSNDLISILQLGEYEDEIVGNSRWTSGDWNCDGEFTSDDLIFALQYGNFLAAARGK